LLFLFCAAACDFTTASAQAKPSAVQFITPSVFLGATGVHTGLLSARNLSITAGVDLTFPAIWKIEPSLEYRGMYPIHKGRVDGLTDNLVGIRLSTRYGHLRPYVDVLAGREETTYVNGGYHVPGKLTFYTQSSSNVLSLGGGTDVLTTGPLALKIDLQLQRYAVPVTVSGHLNSLVGTIGIVYVFHSRRPAP
jgi:hypothetical protein